jgi:hypothetical protein
MASRSDLILRACAANVDHTLAKYNNDSVLEMAVIYAEKAVTATAGATTLAPPALSIARVSGGANV